MPVPRSNWLTAAGSRFKKIMAQGRKKIPNELKALKGTDQPCRINNTPDIQKISKMPPPPKWLSKSAKKIYKTKSELLKNVGIITPLDIETFVTFCHEFGRYIDTAEKLAEVSHNSILNEKQQALYDRISKINRDSYSRAQQLASEFGFSPVSRMKLSIQNNNNKPSIEDILK